MYELHTKLWYSVALPINAYTVATNATALIRSLGPGNSGPNTTLPTLVGLMMKSTKGMDVGIFQMNNLEPNLCHSPASRWWWALDTTTVICSYSSWTEFMSLIDCTWKWHMWTKIIFLICKKTCSTNLFSHYIDLLFPSRPVNGINTYQDTSVQKHLKSFHWGTGKQTIPRYWHTAHWYRLQGTPHIHLHLFPMKVWINVITSMLSINKSEEILTF